MRRCEICLQIKDNNAIRPMASDEFTLHVCNLCYALLREHKEEKHGDSM